MTTASGQLLATVHVATIDHDRCVGCGRCIARMQSGLRFSPNCDAAADVLNCKIAEYTQAIVARTVRASIFRLQWILAPTATAIPKTIRRSSTTSACLRASTPWPWTRLVPTLAMAQTPLPNTVLTESAEKMGHKHEHLHGDRAHGSLLYHAPRYRLA